LFIILFYTAVTNSVNLTDGVDGLCGSVSLVVAIFYIFYGLRLGNGVVTLFAAALAGALVAYLFFNWHPARVFMGDTGSFALGGALATLAIMTKTELLFILVGLIYVIESASVIIQVISFKTRGGKRVFLMAPIHHHFEKKKWSEVKIVGVFTLITAICATVAYLIS
jgi:phospho-N-acetylmuramoyl-pentapeptide-transferase